MAKKKKDKKKHDGSGLSQAAVSMAETVAGLINSPIGRQVVADALVAAAAALVRNRDEAGKAVAHAGAEAAETVGEVAGKAKSGAETAVEIIGTAATQLVSSLVSGDQTSPGANRNAGDKPKKRTRGANSRDGSSEGADNGGPVSGSGPAP